MNRKPQTDDEMRLLETLYDVLFQACWVPWQQVFDSLALIAYAEGLLLLAEYGRVRLETVAGRRVIARRIQNTNANQAPGGR